MAGDGQCFESKIGNHFLRINPQMGKNGRSKVVPLIIKTILLELS